jgi:hypothetical protein
MQVKELAARKAYQTLKQGPFESLAQYSKRFWETYRSYKNIPSATNLVYIEESEQAMDYLHKLEQGRYAVFKTNMLNVWAAGAFNPPDTVNKIFQLAGSWVKPVPKGEQGTAVSYVTLEDDAKKREQEATAAKGKRGKTRLQC